MKSRRIGLLSVAFFCLIPLESMARQVDFPWLSLVPEVGYTFFKKGELEQDYHSEVGARHGVVVKGHLDLGGDRWALELSPLFTRQFTDSLVGDLTGVGGEASLVYRFPSGDVYPGAGIGFHGVYYTPNDYIQRGSDLMVRFPLGLTWYFARYLGLVLEGGVMLGATSIRFKDDDNAIRSNLSEDTEYAFVLGFDLMVGLRFP